VAVVVASPQAPEVEQMSEAMTIPVGIDNVNLCGGGLYVDSSELAATRGAASSECNMR
jgi:hypothetical protein